jgi:hypothetical protein
MDQVATALAGNIYALQRVLDGDSGLALENSYSNSNVRSLN